MRNNHIKSFDLVLACTFFVLIAGCSGTGIAPTPTEDTTYLTPIPEATLASFGSKEIISQSDYSQEFTLHIGDLIQLNRFEYDHSPLAIDNPQILQTISNPRSSIVILRAVAIGSAKVTSFVSAPCPSAPMGCAPPKTFEYVTVIVIAPILQPTTYPMALTVSPTETQTKQTVKTPTYTPAPCPPFIIETKLPDPETPQSYIGHHFISSSTPGLKNIMGAAIGGQPDRRFVLEEVWSSQYKMLWFEKLVCRNDDGRAFWEIIDVLGLPELRQNEILVVQACKQSGDWDIEIVVIGEYKKDEAPLTKITHAWRANRRTEKFEEISAIGIYCERVVGGD